DRSKAQAERSEIHLASPDDAKNRPKISSRLLVRTPSLTIPNPWRERNRGNHCADGHGYLICRPHSFLDPWFPSPPGRGWPKWRANDEGALSFERDTPGESIAGRRVAMQR